MITVSRKAANENTNVPGACDPGNDFRLIRVCVSDTSYSSRCKTLDFGYDFPVNVAVWRLDLDFKRRIEFQMFALFG